jgi:uncharacterized membrane protein
VIENSRSRPYTLSLLLLPVALLVLNDSWAFTRAEEGLDPWFYTGLFLHFPGHIREFADSYYAARLPHVAVGAAAHALFGLPLAAYALRLTYWYLAVLSLYGTVRRTSGSDIAAFVTAVVFGTSVYFLWAIGWDYVDGAAVAFLCGAGYFLCVGSAHRLSMQAIGGILQLCAVSTYVGLAFLVPLQLAHASVVRRRERLPPLSAGGLAVGWTIGLVAFAVLSRLAGASFNYMAPQLRAGAAQSTNREQYITPISVWILDATWLFLPLLTSLCAAALLAVLVRRTAGWRELWLTRGVSEAVLLLVTVAVFVAAELRGFWFLQLSYVSIYMMPFAALGLGAVLAWVFASLEVRRARLVAAGTLVVALLPFVTFVSTWYPRCIPKCVPWEPLGLVVFGTVSVLFVAAIVVRRAAVAVASVLILLGANLIFADQRALDIPSADRRERYETVVTASQMVGARFPDERVRFWYDFNVELGEIYRSIASTYIWSLSLVGEDFPSLTGHLEPDMRVADRNMQLSPGDVIVVPTTRSTGAVLDAFRTHGMTPVVVADDRLVISGKPFHVVSIRLEPVGTLVVIPLDRLQAENGVVRPMGSGSVEVITRDTPYTYAASVDLRQSLPRVRGQMTVAMQVHDVQGRIGLCVLDAKEVECLASKVLDATTDQMVYVTVKDAEQATRLIVESYDKPESGRLAVSALGVLVQEAK